MSTPVSPSTGRTVDVAEFFRTARRTRAQRRQHGLELRTSVPRASLAEVPVAQKRSDPLAVLAAQEETRVASLVGLRRERMAADPFAFLRGAAAVMAGDLAQGPNSGITVQLCGDAHVANFGMFASPERRLVFDLNDFDETLPGPFEWDVKRLAASVVVAARVGGVKPKETRRAARMAARTYRTAMAELAGLHTLDVWFAHLDFDDLLSAIRGTQLSRAARAAGEKSQRRTGASALAKLTEVAAGQRRFRADPPVLVPIPDEERDAVVSDLARVYSQYLTTLPPDRIALLTRFSFVDVAHKVVGVGSVGTRALVLLMASGDGEHLILQIKEAGQSVLEPHLGPSRFTPSGKRVVIGQRVMQATGDPFLGWCSSVGKHSFDFYVRQLRDMKGSIETAGLNADQLQLYARICGGVLARAHARAGDPSVISGYLGKSDEFDVAMADFAVAYADLSERDHAALVASLGDG